MSNTEILGTVDLSEASLVAIEKLIKVHIEKAVDDLAFAVKKGFDEVDERFRNIDKWFVSADTQFKGIHARLDNVETRLGNVEENMVTKDDINPILKDHGTRIRRVETKLQIA